MKSSTRLDSATFQLTPTRTRCDLIISANGKKEKIASGLLNPFLAHLKTAQEQVAEGGYSIILEPEPNSDTTWFTKCTVERFVRFVSTPEILERVYTLESEILQIEEAIAIQGNNDIGQEDDTQAKPLERSEGYRSILDSNEEKAIVLYQPGINSNEANGYAAAEENSKIQLLKVLETRKSVLQKEQGMAFARAVAAGFHFDDMLPLMSFAECYGASRLMDACTKFMELWKRKHETGQWVEIEAAEAMSSRSDFPAMDASGIVLADVAHKQKEFHNELCAEANGKSSTANASEKQPMMHQSPPGHPDYFQGQYPPHIYPPWPIHSPPSSTPVFQAYPMQGMPYYPSYPGNSPYYHPPYPPAEDRGLHNGHRMGQKRHSMESKDSNIESEACEMDTSKMRVQYDLQLEKESSQDQESRKKASRSGKKKSGTVVIRNINYITSRGHSSSGSEESETDEEDGEVISPKSKNIPKSSKTKSYAKSTNEFSTPGKEDLGKEGDGHWEAFQNFLLRDADEAKHTVDQSMFSKESGVKLKRRYNKVGVDPLAFGGRDTDEIQGRVVTDMDRISGKVHCLPKESNDELLISRKERVSRSIDGHFDVQSTEIDGKRGYRRTSTDDFVVHRQQSQVSSFSDPLAVDGFSRASDHLNRRSTNQMEDDSYVVSLRSNSLDQVGNEDRNVIDMESEFPHAVENFSNRVPSQVNYEPDELSLMPERITEKGSTGYDPALDYGMQVQARNVVSLDKKNEAMIDVKQGSKKLDKDQKSKTIIDTSDKRKTGGPMRKGKPSKLSPLDEARARAEKLRNYKADLQKMKKEKEEEDLKRLEALKIERQKRIAARSSFTNAQPSLPSPQTGKRLPTKLSPNPQKGSKFSDSEPGPLSPLRRFSIKIASVGSNDSNKATKPSRSSTGSHSAGSRLTQSVSSLPEPKKDNGSVPNGVKGSMARIRRLSEPKMTSTSSTHVLSVKSQSSEPVLKQKKTDGPETKKVSSIMNLDRSKAAVLPELKIRTSRGPDINLSNSAGKEMTREVNSSTSKGATLERNDDMVSHHDAVDENPVIEKTVLMLECQKPFIPMNHSLDEKLQTGSGLYDKYKMGEQTDSKSNFDSIQARMLQTTAGSVDGELTEEQSQYLPLSHEVTIDYDDKETPKFSSNNAAEKPYIAPYARVSSLEDPSTHVSEYGKAPPTNLEIATAGTGSVKAHVSDQGNLKLGQIPEAFEKTEVKESSKGFKRLLKFGRKNHSSAKGEQVIESDNVSSYGSDADDNAASNEVHTLKNLISQNETPTASTSQKSSRSFSLLSPFRSKSSEKKLMT